jgi:hypothetical protein
MIINDVAPLLYCILGHAPSFIPMFIMGFISGFISMVMIIFIFVIIISLSARSLFRGLFFV